MGHQEREGKLTLLIVISVVFIWLGSSIFPARAADQTAPVAFREVSQESGIEIYGRGRGSAWADVNGDGLDDFGVGLQDGGFHLYRNLGDLHFTEVGQVSGIRIADSVFGVNLVDVDNDGDSDLFLACGGFVIPTLHANHLFLNDGRGRFEEVPEAGGLSIPGYAFSSAWSDVDGDGFLDVFICRIASDGVRFDGRLFRNLGGARFEDATGVSGLSVQGNAQQALFFDVDGDGDPDLLLANRDFFIELNGPEPTGNQLFLNDGTGRFRDASVSGGVKETMEGFAAATADVDRDGDLDLFVGAFNAWMGDVYLPGAPDWLLLNDGEGHFTEVGREAGVASVGGTMGATFFDYDNDGWPDLYVARGGPEPGRIELDLVYRNLGNGHFEESGMDLGIVNRTPGHGVSTCDADRDGDLDLLVPSGGMFPTALARTLFFENLGSPGSGVCFRPQGATGNHDAMGARVLVKVNGHFALQEIVAGSGFASQNPAEAWFGIGAADHLEEVTVSWPNSPSRSARDLPARHRLVCLLPVAFGLRDALIRELDSVTGAALVRLHWEDPRPPGEGRFEVTIRGEEGALPFELLREAETPELEVTLLPGRYWWRVALLDHLGTVSIASPDSQSLVIDDPPEVRPPTAWVALPNPFRGSVRLAGPPSTATGPIQVDIFNVCGAQVATIRADTPSGVLALVWDGRDSEGRPVADGTYWARINTPSRVETLTLVKAK